MQLQVHNNEIAICSRNLLFLFGIIVVCFQLWSLDGSVKTQGPLGYHVAAE